MGENIEVLIQTGTSSIDATGNTSANTMTGTLGFNKLLGMAGNDTIDAGAGSDTLDGGTGNDSLIGGTGNDTYVVDATGDVVVEVANAGTDTVMASITYTLLDYFEDLTLGGLVAINGTGNTVANEITGNDAANYLSGLLGNDTLIGLGGDDTLDGGTGNDSMVGGLGNDYYLVDSLTDKVAEASNGGTDTVESAVSYELSSTVENLYLAGSAAINGTGSASANLLVGNSGANLLSGEGGNDTLYSGNGNDTLDGGSGNDTMTGGDGDDTYYIDSANDVIVELTNGGSDTVVSENIFTLTATLENLTLSGSKAVAITGSTVANILTGNTGANLIRGLEGNDALYGGGGHDTLDGGIGNDVMAGGIGNDTYIIDSSFDTIVELDGEGIDNVTASQSFALAGSIESLTLTGTGDFYGLGSAVANLLTGNTGSNLLAGYGGNDTLIAGDGNDTLDGGTGNDSMVGGRGNDVYYVDSLTDKVIEGLSAGIDTVMASISYTLGTTLEKLTLIGSTAIDGKGNSLSNVLTGNDGNNLLSGSTGNDTLVGGGGNDTLDGGTGNDVMSGGLGDDTYVVGIVTDLVSEAANEGIDTIQSAITRVLAVNFENLTLTGTSALIGTGNAVDNVMTGNAGANKLLGLDGNDRLIGGLGNDSLTGGNGADHFVFNSVKSGIDVIADFNELNGGGEEGDMLEFVGLLRGTFSYVGAGGFTGGADNSEARVVGNKVLVDTNGDGVTDISITLTGLTSAAQLSGTDFLFN